jgi:hypothetical protein
VMVKRTLGHADSLSQVGNRSAVEPFASKKLRSGLNDPLPGLLTLDLFLSFGCCLI